jgi:F-type H+-transporting ATPase subunit delta
MSEVAKEYAGALFALSEEEGLSDQIYQEVDCVAQVLRENLRYLSLLSSPSLTGDEKKHTVKRVFGHAHPYLLHFLQLLTDRGYAREIPACLEEYRRLWRDSRGIVLARVESAVKLTDEERTALIAKLSERLGKKVEVEEAILPALIGGVRVWVDGQLFDGSIRTRLDGIKARLADTVL